MSLCACWGYARCGLLAPHDARTVALCALPRSQHAAGECPPALAETSRVQAQCSAVQYSGGRGCCAGAAQCAGAALARLPGVLLAPAQALLLAAVAPAPSATPDDGSTR